MVQPLSQISSTPPICYPTGLPELDSVLGGGLVRGSTVLTAGVPGAGKSTLLLQLANHIANSLNKRVLYLAGEESSKQIKMRAERLKINSSLILLMEKPEVEEVIRVINEAEPEVLIIDSLQMMYSDTSKSAPGTPTQMKYSLLTVSRIARQKEITVIFIGHATKGGYIAGLQTLQHMVDVVLFLRKNEDDSRTLEVHKNRFGETANTWDTEMTSVGLVTRPVVSEANGVKNINLTSEQFNNLTSRHPFWKPLVKASLEWLYLQQEQQVREERG